MIETTCTVRRFLEKQAQLIKNIHPQPNWKYNSYEELILACGREMNYAPLPKNIKPEKPRACYQNCLELGSFYPELTYCEGYALAEDLVLPVPHAWLINSRGEVIDPTWDCGGTYIGIPFDIDWVISLIKIRDRDDCLSVLESNYMEKFSFLKEGLPNNAIRILLDSAAIQTKKQG